MRANQKQPDMNVWSVFGRGDRCVGPPRAPFQAATRSVLPHPEPP